MPHPGDLQNGHLDFVPRLAGAQDIDHCFTGDVIFDKPSLKSSRSPCGLEGAGGGSHVYNGPLAQVDRAPLSQEGVGGSNPPWNSEAPVERSGLRLSSRPQPIREPSEVFGPFPSQTGGGSRSPPRGWEAAA
jgi:hypothetical protein